MVQPQNEDISQHLAEMILEDKNSKSRQDAINLYPKLPPEKRAKVKKLVVETVREDLAMQLANGTHRLNPEFIADKTLKGSGKRIEALQSYAELQRFALKEVAKASLIGETYSPEVAAKNAKSLLTEISQIQTLYSVEDSRERCEKKYKELRREFGYIDDINAPMAMGKTRWDRLQDRIEASNPKCVERGGKTVCTDVEFLTKSLRLIKAAQRFRLEGAEEMLEQVHALYPSLEKANFSKLKNQENAALRNIATGRFEETLELDETLMPDTLVANAELEIQRIRESRGK